MRHLLGTLDGGLVGERLSTNEARIVEVQAKFTNLGYRLFTFFCFSYVNYLLYAMCLPLKLCLMIC